jgi:hypothetical protein
MCSCKRVSCLFLAEGMRRDTNVRVIMDKIAEFVNQSPVSLAKKSFLAIVPRVTRRAA